MTMRVAKTVQDIRRAVAEARRAGKVIGLVPTMGALHAGHTGLIRAARAGTGFVAVSLFVNPMQFGPGEDLGRYPRPFERDAEICRAEGVDVLFAPEPAEVYPAGFGTAVEVAGLSDLLEGASRPGHFHGVCTVVLKLFHMVQPDVAYFGQKDAQQVRVVRQMVRDLDVPVRLEVCPTVREPDGLALSSRNQYLDADRRRQAAVLYHMLQEAKRRIDAGERRAEAVRQAMLDRLAEAPAARLDYAAVVDADTLRPLERVRGDVLVALAVFLGSTRLIDNLPLRVAD
jgi:pantoate--beta-alanine ligase